MFYSAITKILGDWWANMDVDEKSSFTDLAKQVYLTLGLLLLFKFV